MQFLANDSNHYKFAGKERDGETQLDYFGARYYSNGLGRFITPDWAAKPVAVPYAVLGDPQTLNLYAYVGGNPASKTDPDGHAVPLLALAGGGVLSGVGEGVGIAALVSNPVGWTILGVAAVGTVGYIVYHHYHSGDAKPKAAVTSPQSTPAVPPPPPPPGPPQKPDKGKDKTYQTYKKPNSETGKVYSGRTSGTGTPEENVAARDVGHHMNEQGYGEAQLDKSSTNANAIRGREQQLIDQNGGAQSKGGTSGNAINGVSETNPKAEIYKNAADKEFGPPK